jgi:hypothetical protein
MRRSLSLFATLVLFAAVVSAGLSSCHKTEEAEEESNSFAATINGAKFNSNLTTAKYYRDTNSTGSNADRIWLAVTSQSLSPVAAIALNIDTAVGVGTYTVHPTSFMDTVNAYYYTTSTGAAYTARAGSVTITSKANDRIKGTFNFIGRNSAGSPNDTVAVTNGSFNMSYTRKL